MLSYYIEKMCTSIINLDACVIFLMVVCHLRVFLVWYFKFGFSLDFNKEILNGSDRCNIFIDYLNLNLSTITVNVHYLEIKVFEIKPKPKNTFIEYDTIFLYLSTLDVSKRCVLDQILDKFFRNCTYY